jgi:ABC-type uncharacterized transport system YnjBCD substrate-binding protein
MNEQSMGEHFEQAGGIVPEPFSKGTAVSQSVAPNGRALNRRDFVKLGSAAAATAVLAPAVAGCASDNNAPSGGNTAAGALKVDSDFKAMSWDQVLAEAKGQTVTFLAWGSGGADAYVQKWWDEFAEHVREEYDVTIQYSEYSSAEYEKISTDLKNGADATYDLFWNTGAAIAPIRAADGVFKDYFDRLPNYKYVDPQDSYVAFDSTQQTDNLEVPFQTVNPQLVYSKDKWDSALAWDASRGGVGGLFHDFTELAKWVQRNPGKFSYMDLTAAGGFHGMQFAKAILSELADDGAGGWKTVYDEKDDAATRREKIAANIAEWYAWSQSSAATEQAFYAKAAYLWAYLNELRPYLLKGDNGPMYPATAPDMMGYVRAGDLACTFTTCTSIASRVAATPDNYMQNPAIYMLQTSIGYWDYSIIMSNSKAKAAGLVVSNALLEPSQQIKAFDITGNGYTLDYDKLDGSQKNEFSNLFASMGALSPSAADVSLKSHVDKYGILAKWISSGWDQYVNKA